MGKKRNKSSISSNSKKHKVEFILNPLLTSDKSEINEKWNSNKTNDNKLIQETVNLIKSPFMCCQITDFISSDHLLKELLSEIQDLNYTEKNNDLYKFHQTGDLKNENNLPILESFKEFMYGPVRKYVECVTGIKLTDTVDMFAAKYERTDYLGCHDDELEGRRIAYIMYLVSPKWDEKDGGSLDLFDTDERGEPRNAVKSLFPSWNSFSFFEVSPVSFHRVDEVLSKDRIRWSIGGWFHGDSLPRPEKLPSKSIPQFTKPCEIDEDLFFSWINPAYLNPETQGDIQQKFENDSEISLTDFLSEDKFHQVERALKSYKNWEIIGPANRSHYDRIDGQFPDILKECLNFLTSDPFFLFLSNLTGLKLHPLFETDSDDEEEDKDKNYDPRCHHEIRRWRQGGYTLIRDDDNTAEFALDARLFFGVSDYNLEQGGFSSYVAKDEDEELLTAEPSNNSLVLVYRDADTLKFVKYVNDKINDNFNKEFYDVNLSYYE